MFLQPAPITVYGGFAIPTQGTNDWQPWAHAGKTGIPVILQALLLPRLQPSLLGTAQIYMSLREVLITMFGIIIFMQAAGVMVLGQDGRMFLLLLVLILPHSRD